MIKNLKRRNAIKVAMAGGGLLVLKAVQVEAAPKKLLTVAGSWESKGQPCAIFQQGPILLVVNELGSLGTARMTDADTFAILAGAGWSLGLVGTLVDNGKSINWSNDTTWTRAR